MNKIQINKLARNHALGFLLENAPEVAAIAAFPAKLALYKAGMTKLEQVVSRQLQQLKPAFVERDYAVEDAVKDALRIAGLVLSYAVEMKQPVLATKVRVRPSAFAALRPAQRLQLGQMVHDVALPVVGQLADHGLTAPMLEAFQAKLDTAAEALNAPRSATVSRRAATEHLREAFRAVDEVIVDHFDPLLLALRDTQPEFHRRYLAARMVVEAPGRSRDVEQPTSSAPAATPAAAPAPAAPAMADQPLAA